VGGQLHALAALFPEKEPRYQLGMGPIAGLDAVERRKNLFIAPAGK